MYTTQNRALAQLKAVLLFFVFASLLPEAAMRNLKVEARAAGSTPSLCIGGQRVPTGDNPLGMQPWHIGGQSTPRIPAGGGVCIGNNNQDKPKDPRDLNPSFAPAHHLPTLKS